MSYLNKQYLLQICKYLIIALSLKLARCELQSPCPSVFEYRYDGANNLYGVIEVPNPNDNSNIIRLEVQLSVGNSVQGFNGKIELASPRSQVVDDLFRNRPLQYNLYFPYWVNTPPTIMRILVNENQLCYGYRIDKHLVPVLTVINLQHTLTIGVASNGGSRRPSGSLPGSLPQPSYNYRGQPKNVNKSPTDFNPQQPKDSVNLYFSSNPFLTQNDKLPDGMSFFQNKEPSQNGFNFSPEGGNPFAGDSRPTYHFADGDSSSPNVNNNPFHTNSYQNNGFQIPNTFLSNDNDFNVNYNNDGSHIQNWFTTTTSGRPPVVNNDGSRFQNWFTTTTTARPPLVNRVPPTQVPRDSAVEDLPTVDFNLVQKPFSNVCGISVNANELLVNGNRFAKGMHPWLAALFMQNDQGLKFICGTSLISAKHVVTAAHCIRNGGKKPEPEELWVVLGRENIQRWSNDGAQIIQAESAYIHPEYQPYKADADIAIIILSEKATFSTLIRPICLWTEDSDVSRIVGETGTIIGWGKDESGRLSTPEPRQVVFPVVSEEDCLRSNPAFSEITSNRTFCGGYRNNSGPCNGDSGSGFLMRLNERWALRGIVSMSLLGPERNCDLKQYVVFTDAAKYTDWLLSFLS